MPTAEKDDNTTATAQVRRILRERLTSSFEHFLEHSTEEEKHFLKEVLIHWQSYSSDRPGELSIASSFEEEIRRGGKYLLVEDPKLYGATLQFIQEHQQAEKDGTRSTPRRLIQEVISDLERLFGPLVQSACSKLRQIDELLLRSERKQASAEATPSDSV
jgi:hypothetical protein